ncbi:MAG: dialkylresorcinol condensing enzyme [Burkholderiales bacterium]
MKRVLVVYYSQTGQSGEVVRSFTAPLATCADIELRLIALQPRTPYPFPWRFFRFLDVFPESVHLDPAPIVPIEVAPDEDYDLVILAYQVWFLSPSQPVTAFLKSRAAQRLLAGKPVVTLIACRNMWLMAQEKMKALLAAVGARLTDNVALTDRGGLSTFVTTPRWLLTGRRDGFWGLPPAGLSDAQIAACARFGHALVAALARDEERSGRPMLTGLRAADAEVRLIASERIGHRSFLLWGRLLRAVGGPGSRQRVPVLAIYVVFLVCMIVTVVPLAIGVKALLRPLLARRLAAQKAYFEQPSGSSSERMSTIHG